MERTIRWIGNIGIFILFLICIMLVSLRIQTAANPNNIPSILGIKMLVVLSGSMSPEFEEGDLIFIKDSSNYQTGDIITYRREDSFVTHRVFNVNVENGQASYITKGDANNVEDSDPVFANEIEGKYLWRIPNAGTIFQFFGHPAGLIFIGINVLLIFSIGKVLRFFSKEPAH